MRCVWWRPAIWQHEVATTHSGGDHARRVADQSLAPDRDRGRSLRNICLIGTEADRPGLPHRCRQAAERRCPSQQRVRRGYRCAAGALFRAQEESVRADRKILPNPSSFKKRGWMASGSHCVLLSEGIESHVVDAASIATSRRRRRAKTDRIDGETLLLRALLAHVSAARTPRVCSMVRAPDTPEDEDRRRICRERKVPDHGTGSARQPGSKDCSFSLKAHPRMSRCVAIGERGWKRSRPAMAVACPHISKPRFVENSIGSNCCSSRSRLWRPSETRCSTQNKPKRRPRRRCC